MRQFSGFLALIVLVAIGLGVVYYDRLWPDASRTEMPSAITAGTQEGPGDEAAETTPAIETAAAPSADEGKATVAETPSAKEPSADAMASAAPPATVAVRRSRRMRRLRPPTRRLLRPPPATALSRLRLRQPRLRQSRNLFRPPPRRPPRSRRRPPLRLK